MDNQLTPSVLPWQENTPRYFRKDTSVIRTFCGARQSTFHLRRSTSEFYHLIHISVSPFLIDILLTTILNTSLLQHKLTSTFKLQPKFRAKFIYLVFTKHRVILKLKNLHTRSEKLIDTCKLDKNGSDKQKSTRDRSTSFLRNKEARTALID